MAKLFQQFNLVEKKVDEIKESEKPRIWKKFVLGLGARGLVVLHSTVLINGIPKSMIVGAEVGSLSSNIEEVFYGIAGSEGLFCFNSGEFYTEAE